MKIGTKVYTYNYRDQSMKAGVIVSRALRWNPFPFREYVVREVTDAGTVGIAGVLTAVFNGNPESLTVHTRDSLFLVNEKPVTEDEVEEIE